MEIHHVRPKKRTAKLRVQRKISELASQDPIGRVEVDQRDITEDGGEAGYILKNDEDDFRNHPPNCS